VRVNVSWSGSASAQVPYRSNLHREPARFQDNGAWTGPLLPQFRLTRTWAADMVETTSHRGHPACVVSRLGYCQCWPFSEWVDRRLRTVVPKPCATGTSPLVSSYTVWRLILTPVSYVCYPRSFHSFSLLAGSGTS
jgi:hypothetical protein